MLIKKEENYCVTLLFHCLDQNMNSTVNFINSLRDSDPAQHREELSMEPGADPAAYEDVPKPSWSLWRPFHSLRILRIWQEDRDKAFKLKLEQRRELLDAENRKKLETDLKKPCYRESKRNAALAAKSTADVSDILFEATTKMLNKVAQFEVINETRFLHMERFNLPEDRMEAMREEVKVVTKSLVTMVEIAALGFDPKRGAGQ